MGGSSPNAKGNGHGSLGSAHAISIRAGARNPSPTERYAETPDRTRKARLARGLRFRKVLVVSRAGLRKLRKGTRTRSKRMPAENVAAPTVQSAIAYVRSEWPVYPGFAARAADAVAVMRSAG